MSPETFTLASLTQLVTFEVKGATAPAKMGLRLILGFAATGTILRSDFNFALKCPTLILGDEIKFTIDAEADK
jgi:polyisoprenoid-binding protein YceI